jgi:hypothetical protein
MKKKISNSNEQWKPVLGFEGAYEVSTLGRVRSLTRITRDCWGGTRTWPGRMLKPKPGKKYGYVNLRLHANGKSRSTSIHVLVAEVFVPNPENKPEVNHKNSDRTCNRATNLEWMTKSEQQHHAFKYGFKTGARGTRQWMSKLKEKDVREIRKQCAAGKPESQIARDFSICQQHVHNIVTFKKWAWLDSPQVSVSKKDPGIVRANSRRLYEKAS